MMVPRLLRTALALLSVALLVLVPSLTGPAAPAVAGPADPTNPDVVVAGADGELLPFFPDITRLNDGRLVTVFYQAPTHSGSVAGPYQGQNLGRIAWTESRDNGQTWSTPRVALDTPYDDRDPQIVQLRDGTILLSWFESDWTNYPVDPAVILGSFVARSTDGGQTWSQPVRVGSRMSCSCGSRSGAYRVGWSAESGKILELDNGDLLIPLYGTLPDSPQGRASVVRSTDGGRTWPIDREVFIPAPPKVALSETALAKLSGNRVVALSRTSPSYFAQSPDGGHSWSTGVPTSITAQAPHLLALPGGAVLATYGDASGQFQSNEPIVGQLLPPGGSWLQGYPTLMYKAKVNTDQGDPSTVALPGNRFFTVSYDQDRHIIVGTYSALADFQSHPAGTPAGPSILDLAGMYQRGEVDIATDLMTTYTTHPGVSPAGAIDGVPQYWNSAVGVDATSASPRQFTLTFDHPQHVGWVGLTLKPGYAESAAVYVSHDGTEWGSPVYSASDVTSAAGPLKIAWVHIRSASVRSVKVVLTASAGAAMLSELALAS